MDFWNYFTDTISKEKISEERVMLGGRKSTYLPSHRANSSFSSISALSREINIGELFLEKNSIERRYVLAHDLTYDLFVSLYSVSNRVGVFFRISTPITKKEESLVRKAYAKLDNKHIEARLIGMQSKQGNFKELINSVLFLGKLRNSLVEVDLFGNEVRHVAIDLKTGLSYNILMNDVIYKPGELANTLSFDKFSKKPSGLKFV